MRMTYDPSADAGYVFLSDDEVEESSRLADRVIADFDNDGRLVGVELLDASAPLDVATLRALPKARHALGRLHEMALESIGSGKAAEADAFLNVITQFKGTLAERRLKVAAQAGGAMDRDLQRELKRRGVLESPRRAARR